MHGTYGVIERLWENFLQEKVFVQKKEFDRFDVYFSGNGHSFVYADFKGTDSFIEIIMSRKLSGHSVITWYGAVKELKCRST